MDEAMEIFTQLRLEETEQPGRIVKRQLGAKGKRVWVVSSKD